MQARCLRYKKGVLILLRGSGLLFGMTETSLTPRWHIIRRMYDWVLHFAHHKHSTTALFTLSFAESSFFPIPPDVLLGPLCLGHRKKSLWFATVCTTASVMGAFLGYLIGFSFLEIALNIPGITQGGIDDLAQEFTVRGQWYVFIAALTPIPFKLLTITAGVAEMNRSGQTKSSRIRRYFEGQLRSREPLYNIYHSRVCFRRAGDLGRYR